MMLSLSRDQKLGPQFRVKYKLPDRLALHQGVISVSSEIRTDRLSLRLLLSGSIKNGDCTLASAVLPGTHGTGADTQESPTITYRLEPPGYLTARLTAPAFLR